MDACRSVRILETMTKEEALKLKLEHSSYYFRAFNGKLNFARPVEQSDWFRFENVALDNHPVFGDEVGVATHWVHPGTLEAVLSDITLIQIKAEVGQDPIWRENRPG